MLIEQIMTTKLFITHPNSAVTDAQDLMRRERIHHLPVVDRRSKKLVGIVTEKDLLYASPSPASTLNVYEITRLLSELRVERVMTKGVVTAVADEPIENAARLMADRNIGCIPIVDAAGVAVGLVTESDVFRVFIDFFGTRERGVRLTARVPESKGELARLTKDISNRGGNIVSLGTLPGTNATNATCIVKVEGLTESELVDAITSDVLEILDVRVV